MIYLKLFEELTNPELATLYKKVSKHNYLSKSSIEKLKSLGVSEEDFNRLKNKVSKAYKFEKILKEGEETLEYLFIELDDMLDEYNTSFTDRRINTSFEVANNGTYFSLYNNGKDPGNKYFSLDTNEVETTFEIIDSIITDKEAVYKINREKQKDDGGSSTHSNKYRRDWGNLSKFKKSDIFYKNIMMFRMDVYLQLKIESNDYEYGTQEYHQQQSHRNKISNRVNIKIKDIIEKFFELNDFSIAIKSSYNYGANNYLINIIL